MVFDSQLPQRLACCFLDSAAALLEDHGIPVPDRVEFLQHRFDVFPGACSAMLLRDVLTTNVTAGDNECDVSQVEINWELQVTQCMNVRDPNCEDCGDQVSGDCRDRLRCPSDEPFVFESDPCSSGSKVEETDQISSARWVLTKLLAAEVKACLCDPGSAPYPAACVDECGPLAHCQYLRLNSVSAVDGGGCAGFLMRFQSRH